MSQSYRDPIVREVLTFRRSLKTLDSSLRRLSPMLTVAMRNGARVGKARSRPRLTAKARASMVLQGRYMGYMRQLKPRQKALVRKIREAKGVRLAIQKARQVLGA